MSVDIQYTDQWNRTDIPETNPCIYGQLIFDKSAKTIQWRWQSFHQIWKKCISTCERVRLNPLPHTISKNYLKNGSYTAKETINKMRRQSREWKKIFASHISDKGLTSKICKKVIQLSSEKTIWFKNGQRISINIFSKEDIQTANRYMKRHSTWLIIRDSQMKTTMRHHRTRVRMAVIKNTRNNQCWQGCREKATLVHCGWERNWCSRCGNSVDGSVECQVSPPPVSSGKPTAPGQTRPLRACRPL